MILIDVKQSQNADKLDAAMGYVKLIKWIQGHDVVSFGLMQTDIKI